MGLADRRKEKKMTQNNLAKLLNLDRTTISKWETGENIPSISTLQKLAIFYNCTVDELLKDIKDEVVFDAQPYSKIAVSKNSTLPRKKRITHFPGQIEISNSGMINPVPFRIW